MGEAVIKIMITFIYYPRFVLRDVEPTGFNCPEQASTIGGGYSGRALTLIEEEKVGDYQQSPSIYKNP